LAGILGRLAARIGAEQVGQDIDGLGVLPLVFELLGAGETAGCLLLHVVQQLLGLHLDRPILAVLDDRLQERRGTRVIRSAGGLGGFLVVTCHPVGLGRRLRRGRGGSGRWRRGGGRARRSAGEGALQQRVELAWLLVADDRTEDGAV